MPWRAKRPSPFQEWRRSLKFVKLNLPLTAYSHYFPTDEFNFLWEWTSTISCRQGRCFMIHRGEGMWTSEHLCLLHADLPQEQEWEKVDGNCQHWQVPQSTFTLYGWEGRRITLNVMLEEKCDGHSCIHLIMASAMSVAHCMELSRTMTYRFDVYSIK
jgi:hypothetical protein